jgi:hypothetical protein
LLLLLLLAGAASAVLIAPPRSGGRGHRAETAAVADAAGPSPAERVERFALQAVRSRLGPAAAAGLGPFEVRTYRFGPVDQIAVCGLAVQRDGTTAEPFVARVYLPAGVPSATGEDSGTQGPGARPPLVVMEEGPGLWRDGGEARRRYCQDAIAPAIAAAGTAGATGADQAVTDSAADATAAATPPAEGGGGPRTTATAATTAPAAVGAEDPAERVVVRSPANVRAGPGGGAPVLGVAPRGASLTVRGRAPGGWVRVAGPIGGPEGWVHSSLLEPGPSP